MPTKEIVTEPTGSWTAFYSENARQWYVDIEGGGQFVIKPTAAGMTKDETAAIVRRAAAAPDLLAALIDMFAMSEIPACVARDRAVAAIAKAEGR